MILALDIGGTSMKLASFVNEQMEHFEEVPTHAQKGTEALLNTICSYAEKFGKLSALGISTTGQVKNGTITFATESMPGYTGTPLRSILEERLKLPVAVLNDVNAAGLGEAAYGCGKGCEHFLFVAYGTGIGGAIIVNKAVYEGLGSAGEVGHLITHPEGLPCVCGGRGCYEMYASTNALIQSVQTRTGLQLNGRQIFAALEQTSSDLDLKSKLQPILQDWIQEIVLGLVSLTHALHPERIVLGGGVMEQAYCVEEITRELQKKLIPSFRGTQVHQSLLGNKAGLMGAMYACLLL